MGACCTCETADIHSRDTADGSCKVVTQLHSKSVFCTALEGHSIHNSDPIKDDPNTKSEPKAKGTPDEKKLQSKLLDDMDDGMDDDTCATPKSKSYHVSHHKSYESSHSSGHSTRSLHSKKSIRSSGRTSRRTTRKHEIPKDVQKHEIPKDVQKHEIPKDAPGPLLTAMDDDLPDWRWEVRNNKWSSYARHDAIELERYWQYYAKSQCYWRFYIMKRPYIARLQLAGKEAIINFQAMTIQVNGGKVRILVRHQLPKDWLTNSWFFAALTNFLGNQAIRLGVEPWNLFDSRYNQDFRDNSTTSRTSHAGIEVAGRVYKPPFGWKRFAANVHGKYTESPHWFWEIGAGAWAVAYHGLMKETLPDILYTGFAGQRTNETNGMDEMSFSCTPFLEVAEQDTDTEFCNDHNIQIILQVRVRPTAVQKETHNNPYWLIKNPDDVRIYGVLVREVPK